MQLHLQLWQDLIDLCDQLNCKQYTHKCTWLSGASIGEHVRHSYEFYDCLLLGIEKGSVNYDVRPRNALIETNCDYAIEKMESLKRRLAKIKVDDSLSLITKESTAASITTSIARELVYCLDHAVHHQALIKIGLKALDCSTLINENFGVAYSTLRYRAKHKP